MLHSFAIESKQLNMGKMISLNSFVVALALISLSPAGQSLVAATQFADLPEMEQTLTIQMLDKATRKSGLSPMSIIRLGVEKWNEANKKQSAGPSDVADHSQVAHAPENGPLAALIRPEQATPTPLLSPQSPLINEPTPVASAPSETASVEYMSDKLPDSVIAQVEPQNAGADHPAGSGLDGHQDYDYDVEHEEPRRDPLPMPEAPRLASARELSDSITSHEPIHEESFENQEEPVKEEVFEDSYIDHSDPNNPQQVQIKKHVKSRVDPNTGGISHENSETRISTSIGDKNSPSTFKQSSSSSSFSSSSSSSSSSSGGKHKRRKNRGKQQKGSFHQMPMPTMQMPAMPYMPTIHPMAAMMPGFGSVPMAATWPGYFGGQELGANAFSGQFNPSSGAFASAFAGPINSGGFISKSQAKKLRKRDREARKAMNSF